MRPLRAPKMELPIFPVTIIASIPFSFMICFEATDKQHAIKIQFVIHILRSLSSSAQHTYIIKNVFKSNQFNCSSAEEKSNRNGSDITMEKQFWNLILRILSLITITVGLSMYQGPKPGCPPSNKVDCVPRCLHNDDCICCQNMCRGTSCISIYWMNNPIAPNRTDTYCGDYHCRITEECIYRDYKTGCRTHNKTIYNY
ncbi:uncharacterized protein ACN427_001699 [Glossina fuscipes fuscipes]